MDGWTEITRRVRERVSMLPPQERTLRDRLRAFEDADFEKMEQIRARVDATITPDSKAVPATAKRLPSGSDCKGLPAMIKFTAVPPPPPVLIPPPAPIP